MTRSLLLLAALLAAACGSRPLCIGGLCRNICDEGGCDAGGVVTVSPLGALTAIQVDLIDPANLGSPTAPITAKTATFNILTLDGEGQPYTDPVDVDVFVSFGGVRTGADTTCGSDSSGTPIATLPVTGGIARNNQITLPHPFSATSIWVEDRVSHAAGASPTMYFRGPTIPEMQTPDDIKANNATFCTAFNRKFVVVDHATGTGSLVVSSVFGNAFAVTDTGASNFASAYVFTFGKPPTQIVRGRILADFSGNVSKFIGFTELNFPLWHYAKSGDELLPARPDLVPPALEIKWEEAFPLDDPNNPMSKRVLNIPLLLGHAAGVVKVEGTICDPTVKSNLDSWNKFNQLILDAHNSCDDVFNNFALALPSKTLGKFDPLAHVGSKVTVVGMLKNSSGQNPELDANGFEIACKASSECPGSSKCVDNLCRRGVFNFWTVLPRTAEDISY